MTLGEIIRVYRKEHGLSQRQFANLCGDVSNGYISMIEHGKNPVNGKPIILSVEKVAMFARAMGMSINQLVEMADDMPIDIGDSAKDKYSFTSGDEYSSKTEQVPAISEIEFALSGEIHDLTESEMQDVLDYVRFKRAQREAKP